MSSGLTGLELAETCHLTFRDPLHECTNGWISKILTIRYFDLKNLDLPNLDRYH